MLKDNTSQHNWFFYFQKEDTKHYEKIKSKTMLLKNKKKTNFISIFKIVRLKKTILSMYF